MVLGRLVPWRSWEEWEEVRQGLFSPEHPQQRTCALQQVSLWRCRGRVPLSIDISACLLDIRDRDEEIGQASPARTAEADMQLRLQYAMTVVRLVNGISDSSQKGRVAVSVAALAHDAGLPRVLVDVRHEASHNELPSLALLRLAARRAVEWLRDFYWTKQAQNLDANRERITTLLKEFWEQRSAAASKGARLGAKKEGMEVGDDSSTASGRDGPDAQKQKRPAAAELKELGHGVAPEVVASAVLDHGALPPPLDGDVSLPALEGTLASLSGWFPELWPAMLLCAVRRLTQRPTDSPRGRDEKTDRAVVLKRRPAICLSWVAWILSSAHRKKAGKASKTEPEQRANAAQLTALLALCLRVPACTAPSDVRSQEWQSSLSKLRSLLDNALQKCKETPKPGARKLAEVSSGKIQAVGDSAGAFEQLQKAAEGDIEVQLADLQRALKRKRAPRSEDTHRASGHTSLPPERYDSSPIGSVGRPSGSARNSGSRVP